MLKTMDNDYLPESPMCLRPKGPRIFPGISWLFSTFPTQSNLAVSPPGPLCSLRNFLPAFLLLCGSQPPCLQWWLGVASCFSLLHFLSRLWKGVLCYIYQLWYIFKSSEAFKFLEFKHLRGKLSLCLQLRHSCVKQTSPSEAQLLPPEPGLWELIALDFCRTVILC